MRSSRIRLATLTVALLTAGLTGVPPAQATYPGFSGWIAYQSAGDIFVYDPISEISLNLTRHPADDGNPQWSPDGTKILFNSDRDGTQDIWMLDLGGKKPSKAKKVAGWDGLEFDPTWCSNETFAFMTDYNFGNLDGDFEIYFSPGDLLTSPERITDNSVFDGHPNCNTDGVIAFHSTVSAGNNDLFVYDPSAGGPPAPLLQGLGNQAFPSWYPDNSALVYVHTPVGGDADVYRVEADGSNPVGLLTGPDNEWDPAVSPDGSMLTGGIEDMIYITDLFNPATNFRTLSTPNAAFSPDWQPVNEGTVFSHERKVTFDATKKTKKVRIVGSVEVVDGFDECADNVDVQVQVKKRRKLKTIKTITTDFEGGFETKVPAGFDFSDLRIRLPVAKFFRQPAESLQHICLADIKGVK